MFDRITRTRQNTADTAAALMLALKIAEDEHVWAFPHSDSFFNFWLLATGQLTAGFSWTDHGEKYYAREDFNQMIRLTSKFVHETCKDLLVVVERADFRLSADVEFLHRTVYDFLHDSHLRFVIEQQSPDHFKDADFLVGLGKLRCVGLLSKSWQNCEDAEDTFGSLIIWSQLPPQPDVAWFSRCELLMLNVHQRMQKAGICREYHHRTSWIHAYIALGLSEYLLALIVSWPCLAIRPSFFIPTGRAPANEILDEFLSGWLTLIFAEPDIKILNSTMICGLRSTSSSWGHVASLNDDAVYSPDHSTACLQRRLACMLGDRRLRLFHSLLNCGINPNRQIRWDFGVPMAKPECRGSVWQNWLRAVSLQIEEKTSRRPDGFDSISDSIKNKVGDIVAVFLRHGADPNCLICISNRYHMKDCRLEPLESVLATITSQDRLGQLQALRIAYATRFDQRIARSDRMLRAMRSWTSWTASTRAASSSDTREGPQGSLAFLSGFARNVGGFPCNCPSKCRGTQGFTSAFCLDCTRGYYACSLDARRCYHEDPTLDDVSRHMVRECLPLDEAHEYIWFGQYDHSEWGWKMYGVESSIFALEVWYARNTNGEDATLD